MGGPFDIVKDSSIWYNRAAVGPGLKPDSTLYTGTVRSVENDAQTGELRYVVDVYYRGDTFPAACRMMRRLGGAFNYEDIIFRGFSYATSGGSQAKSGDHVIVAFLGGQGKDGIILGGLSHPTRKNLSKSNGPEYRTEFNGVETYINKDGEYTLTFRGQPTNLADLDKQRDGPVPSPKYDADIGSGYLKWDKSGSFTVTDNAKSDPQTFFIDKENGTVELLSGSVSLRIDKGAKSVDWDCQSYVLTSPSIKLGGVAAFEQAVLGTTYRLQQTTMNSNLIAQLSVLSASLAAAGAALTTAGADPVLVGIAPTAAAAIATAAAAVIAGGVSAGVMAGAITAFEAGTPSYLSNVVKVK